MSQSSKETPRRTYQAQKSPQCSYRHRYLHDKSFPGPARFLVGNKNAPESLRHAQILKQIHWVGENPHVRQSEIAMFVWRQYLSFEIFRRLKQLGVVSFQAE